ncbi:MAG: C4-type zinc ribbon domain-containing protein [Actinomycetia bacterium]|nr:C4-type zinc ribbon domain-containing protein [Actinomycetes bacterium]
MDNASSAGSGHHDLEELPLKADPSAQLMLLDLQQHDSSLLQLDRRRKTLPELAKLEELATGRYELDGRRIEAETSVSDLGRAQRKADGEVETVKARRERDQKRLDQGVITNPKDLENLQHEMEALERRITTLEDEELEVMEQLETAQGDLDGVQAELADIDRQIAELEGTRDESLADIDAKAGELTSERAQTASSIPDDLHTLYDKLRGQYGGVGAAALVQRRCEGCRLELNAADLRELAAEPDDTVLRCPECSRILVRTRESGL